MEQYIPAYIKAEKFLIDKLGYTKEDVIKFNKQDPYQILKLYNTIRGINRNIKNTARLYNYWAFD